MVKLRSSAAYAGDAIAPTIIAFKSSLRICVLVRLFGNCRYGCLVDSGELPDGHEARPAGRGAFDTPLPAPAGFLAAGFLRVGIGLFPLGDRTSLVVRHLVVHAGAVFEDHG